VKKFARRVFTGGDNPVENLLLSEDFPVELQFVAVGSQIVIHRMTEVTANPVDTGG